MSLLLKTTTQYGTFISQLARELAPQLVKSATNIFFQKECTTSACSEVSFQFMISSPAPPLTAAMRRRAGAGTPTNSSVIVDGAISDPIIPNKKTVHTHQWNTNTYKCLVRVTSEWILGSKLHSIHTRNHETCFNFHEKPDVTSLIVSTQTKNSYATTKVVNSTTKSDTTSWVTQILSTPGMDISQLTIVWFYSQNCDVPKI